VGGGRYVNAQAFGEFAVGLYSLNDAGASATTFVAGDRIFTIGNGTGAGSESNALVILKDGSSTFEGNMQVNGDLAYSGTLTNSSDKRLKKDIVGIQDVLSELITLEGYRYRYNNIKATDTLSLHIGLIAQEVEKVYPELIKKGKDGYLSLDYMGMVPLLLEAIKELSQQNVDLKIANASLEIRQQGDDDKFAKLEAKLDYLMQMMAVEASVSTTGND